MPNYNERFDDFFNLMIENEGWVSDDSIDSGGKTLMGISKNNFPKEFEMAWYLYEHEHFMFIKIYVKNFYFIRFYNKLYDSILDSSLAFKLFDFGVNAGVRKAVKILQRTINSNVKNYYNGNKPLKVDGIYGDCTHKKLNNLLAYQNSLDERYNNELQIYNEYVERIEKFYKSLWNFFRFGKGWLNRLKKIYNGMDYFIASSDIQPRTVQLINKMG